LREVISAYQKCVGQTVRRFGGFVAQYMGDGVLVYFGYPQAHEDDAEQAVRAGLELIAAVAALNTHCSLQTRVGIATGLVVVGDLNESGEAQECGIVGETPNLAARLQALRTEHSRHRRRHAAASWQSFRTRRSRTKRPQGPHRPDAGLGGAAREFGGRPLLRQVRSRPRLCPRAYRRR
jgi:class 3 adenylate cyclase